jgi:DNA-binding MarR family transcriptional regulator
MGSTNGSMMGRATMSVNRPSGISASRGLKRLFDGDRELAFPTSLLRYPTAVMFLLMREGYRLTQRREETTSSVAERLRFPHFAVLACLDEFGASSQQDVSRRLGFDPSDVVGFVDHLEEAGLVERRRDEHDRRRYAVDLTPAGRQALRARERIAERMNDELLRGLTPSERTTLQRLLRKAAAALGPDA